jgi:cell division protein FtsZ
MGTGSAKGENRAVEAATQAISSPLLENVKIDGATGIIINVTGGSDLSLYEVNEASTLITEAASEDAEVIFGAVIDPNIIDEVRVTVIATGFAREEKFEGMAAFNSMQSFLNTSPTISFDVPQMAPTQMNQQMYQQVQQQAQPMFQQQPTHPFQQPVYQQPMYQQQQAPVMPVMPQFPPITNVQESIKSFTNEVQVAPAETTSIPVGAATVPNITAAIESELTTEISPVASTSSASTARDILLAKAKAFRETQVGQPIPADKVAHPEQLSMMDEEKQVEEARKMARDILEVPAFIRKKQGFDLQNN